MNYVINKTNRIPFIEDYIYDVFDSLYFTSAIVPNLNIIENFCTILTIFIQFLYNFYTVFTIFIQAWNILFHIFEMFHWDFGNTSKL